MLLILLSILLFSFNNLLWKKALLLENLSFLITYRSFFTVSGLLLGLVVFSVNIDYSFTRYLNLTIGSISGLFGLICMLKVLKKASLRWVGIYHLVGVMLLATYLSIFEGISVFKYGVGPLLIIIGFLWFLSAEENSSERLELKDHGLLFLMITFFNFSSVMHWWNLGLQMHPLLVAFNQELIVFIGGAFWLVSSKQIKQSIKKLGNRFLVVLRMASLVIVALLFSLYGLKVTDPFLSGLLFLLSPIMTITFGVIYFKERISWSSVGAIVIISVGTFLIYSIIKQ